MALLSSESYRNFAKIVLSLYLIAFTFFFSPACLYDFGLTFSAVALFD